MSTNDPQTITRLLRETRQGEPGASESLLPIVYDELHCMARALFLAERKDHILQPTALIHEAWLKLSGHLGELGDRQHFFTVASRAMRQVLTDYARRSRSLKRGDGCRRITLDEALNEVTPLGIDLVDLDDSLTRLSHLNPRHAQVVEMRMLGGLTVAETAELLGLSQSTVEGDWFTAKAWLRRELQQAR